MDDAGSLDIAMSADAQRHDNNIKDNLQLESTELLSGITSTKS